MPPALASFLLEPATALGRQLGRVGPSHTKGARVRFRLAAFMVVGLTGGIAEASTVTFEDVAQAPGAQTALAGSLLSGGFLFAFSANHGHLGNNSVTFMDSTALVTDDFLGTDVLTMTAATGGTFALGSAQFAEACNNAFYSSGCIAADSATQISVTGHFFGGGSVSRTVLLDGIHDGPGGAFDGQLEVFDWANLTSVDFDAVAGAGNSYWGLDNVDATAVPEPATLLLLGSGLAALARSRRRDRA
jgi:hypothetical protein